MQFAENGIACIRSLNKVTEIMSTIKANIYYLNDVPAPPESLVQEIITKNSDEIQRAEQAMQAYMSLPIMSEGTNNASKVLYSAFKALLGDYRANLEYLKANHYLKGVNNGEMERSYDKALMQYNILVENQITEKSDASESRAMSAVRNSVITIILALLICIAIHFWLRKNLFNRLLYTSSLLEKIGQGELYHQFEIGPRNELGHMLEALSEMGKSLSGIVRNVHAGSTSISNSTKEMEAGNQDLSSRTEEQASALQQTAASTEELRITVRQNADNARHASQLSVDARTIAHQGGTVMDQVIDTMRSITSSSRKIADINAVIDSIANQTNILALNAAVEAARAGEQGRGFAVVASEVRNLAKRSSDAAKEISTLINESVSNIDNGSGLVEKAGNTIREIVTSVTRVSDIMGEITSATEEQSMGIDQIAQAINEMDNVTQQNAALVEQSAAVASSMAEQSYQLQQSVAMLKTSATGTEMLVSQEFKKSKKHETPLRPVIKEPKKRASSQEEWDSF